MRAVFYLLSCVFLFSLCSCTTESKEHSAVLTNEVAKPAEWTPLFGDELSEAIYADTVWSIENGELTATEDQNIWTKKDYNDFELELEFKTADGTNSGVILYCSDTEEWIPNSVEIQIADDYNETWAKADPNWRCGAVFGHQAANTPDIVKKPGEWNRYSITCKGPMITVILNDKLINTLDMRLYTSSKINPDSTAIPSWLSKPLASLPTKGRIGLQGKHAGAPVWFRNLRIREL